MSCISQEEVNYLLKLDKYYLEDKTFEYPYFGKYVKIPLFSLDKRNEFILDIARSRISLEKNTFQTRTQKTIILARLDMGGRPHRNPDGLEIGSPHIHIYDPEYGDKIAYKLPKNFSTTDDHMKMLSEFMDFCCIISKPIVTNILC